MILGKYFFNAMRLDIKFSKYISIEAGTHKHGGNRDIRTPKGTTGPWVQDEGDKGVSEPAWEQ